MSKPKLFLDHDGVLVDTIKSYCQSYNELYCHSEGFKLANSNLVNDWDMKSQCPLVKNPEDIFSSRTFFANLGFMDNAYQVLKRLSNRYELIICSIGSYDNISLKSQWIQAKLPFIKDSVLIINNGCKMDKSIVQMKNNNGMKNIFIDDHQDNLFSSNADIKICFGKKYPWNEKWINYGYNWCKDWLEVEQLLEVNNEK